MKKIFFACICSLQLVLVACQGQVPGCTDPLANNFDSKATVNDGSCTYDPVELSPETTSALSGILAETSGLILWDDYVWTHNDNADTVLYGVDTLTAEIMQEYPLAGVVNVDWEEVSQDEEYIYMGDFGNNGSGNRTDLKILRIDKGSLTSGAGQIDTISFSYADQSDFSPKPGNSTDYDCEALIVTGDSIYLFTKQWLSAGTSIYALPKLPGTYSATLIDTYDIQGLVTGATFLESERLLVLSAYTSMLSPFFYLFYDFTGTDFLSGNKRRVGTSLSFHQVEGIATLNGLKYFVSNEHFTQIVNTPQKLHVFDLTSLLGNYLSGSTGVEELDDGMVALQVYPNPASDKLYIKSDFDLSDQSYEILDHSGRQMMHGILPFPIHSSGIPIESLARGMYFIRIGGKKHQVVRSFIVE